VVLSSSLVDSHYKITPFNSQSIVFVSTETSTTSSNSAIREIDLCVRRDEFKNRAVSRELRLSELSDAARPRRLSGICTCLLPRWWHVTLVVGNAVQSLKPRERQRPRSTLPTTLRALTRLNTLFQPHIYQSDLLPQIWSIPTTTFRRSIVA